MGGPKNRATEAREDIAVKFVVALIFPGFLAVIYFWIGDATIPKLFGDKKEAVLDTWTLQHFFSGVITYPLIHFMVFGTVTKIKLNWRSKLELALVTCLLAYVWEVFELVLEVGRLDSAISIWKNGVEHWSNRMIGDPVAMFAGALAFAKHRSRIFIPSLVLATLWLIINISMPDCMYVQRKIVLWEGHVSETVRK